MKALKIILCIILFAAVIIFKVSKIGNNSSSSYREEITTENWHSKMSQALLNSNGTLFKQLMDSGIDVNLTDKRRRTALHYYAAEDHARNINSSMLDRLLAAGANLNLKDYRGLTVLMYASYAGKEELVAQLLDKGADADLTDYDGRTALMLAMFHSKNNEVEDRLLRYTKNVNAVDKDGNTALTIAAHERRISTVKALLHKGADPDHKNKEGRSARDILGTEYLEKLSRQ